MQRLMASHMIEDLTSCILDFQANMVRIAYRKKATVVEPEIEFSHTAALRYIWDNSKAREEPDGEGGTLKWRKIGFDTEDLMQEFGEVGVLGLDCLVCLPLVEPEHDLPYTQRNFVAQDPDYFAKVCVTDNVAHNQR